MEADYREQDSDRDESVRDDESSSSLKPVNAEREELERMACLGRMVAMVSHELNNRLTGVLGFADLLATKSEGTERLKTKLQDCAGRLRLLTESLSGFSSLRTNREEQVRLGTLLRQALEVARCESKAVGVVLELQTEESIEECRRWTRPGEFRLGLFLCISALTHSIKPGGQGLRVHAEAHPSGEQGELTIRISAPISRPPDEATFEQGRALLGGLGAHTQWVSTPEKSGQLVIAMPCEWLQPVLAT